MTYFTNTRISSTLGAGRKRLMGGVIFGLQFVLFVGFCFVKGKTGRSIMQHLASLHIRRIVGLSGLRCEEATVK